MQHAAKSAQNRCVTDKYDYFSALSLMKNTGMQAYRRDTSVISKALGNFLSASILTSVASQLAITTDAVIVSHLIGPDAISAINVSMPVTMLFSCVSILVGLGASIVAARAMGCHDNEKVKRIFTTAILLLATAGTAVSAITYIYSEEIVASLCNDSRVYPLATEYIRVMAAGALFLIFSNGINYFVSTDGKPGLVAKGVVAGAVANVVLDIIMVRIMGIAGSAWATIINYAITLCFVATHFWKKESSYSLTSPFKGFMHHAAENVYEGMPLMLGNLLLGAAVLVINKIIHSVAGADGLYIWSICLQVLMLTFVVLNGVGNAMLSIGGILAGEEDYNGVRILTRLSLKLVCTVLAVFVLSVMIFPQALAFMFGNDADCNIAGAESALRIFSLLLIPFAVTLTMRFLFQVLEYRILSLVMSAGQLLFIVACLWLFKEAAPGNIWWSFPLSAVVLIAIQLLTTFALWLKRRDVSPVTLIPQKEKRGFGIDFSVNCKSANIGNAVETIREFLSEHGIEPQMAENHSSSCMDIMGAIADKSSRCSLDVHVCVVDMSINTTLRAAGKNIPEIQQKTGKDIMQKQMYGVNVFFIH